MKHKFTITTALLALAAGSLCLGGEVQLKRENGKLQIGEAASDAIAFHGAAPVAQVASAAQAALTDSTTGTASATLAAGVGVQKIIHPLTSLATGLSTSAIDLVTNITPGFKGKILKTEFVPTVAGTGTSASQVFNVEIGTTNVTGGVVTVTLASTATIGAVVAGTAVTAANTFTAADTISIEMAAGGTVFTAGAGYFVITVQNMDTADAVASLANLANALRTVVVNKGLAKGSN